MMRAALVLVKRVAAIARRVAGVPDYEAYVAHVRTRHPGREVLSRGEFFAARIEARYRGSGGRCC
jgi:uncharacterized short protein YbdD (DUF466 family)